MQAARRFPVVGVNTGEGTDENGDGGVRVVAAKHEAT